MLTPIKRKLIALTLVSGLLFVLSAVTALGQSEADGQGILINKLPLKDFSRSLNEDRARREVNLGAAFSIRAECSLNKDGHLDSARTKVVEQIGDPKLIEIAKDMLVAMADSGYLGYLKTFGADKFVVAMRQDSKVLAFSVNFDLENETRARSVISSLNMLIAMGQAQKTVPDADANDREDLLLLQGVTTTSDGKKVSISAEWAKDQIQPLIKRKLGQVAEDKKQVAG